MRWGSFAPAVAVVVVVDVVVVVVVVAKDVVFVVVVVAVAAAAAVVVFVCFSQQPVVLVSSVVETEDLAVINSLEFHQLLLEANCELSYKLHIEQIFLSNPQFP